MWVVWLVFLRGKRGSIAAIAAIVFRGEEESPMLSPCIYNPYKCAGCLGIGPRLFLPPFWVILGWFLIQFSPRIGRSNTNFCWVFSVAVDSEIDSQKVCYRCRFRNRQRRTVVDSEIGSRTVSLSIQKSTPKNYATDSEIDN